MRRVLVIEEPGENLGLRLKKFLRNNNQLQIEPLRALEANATKPLDLKIPKLKEVPNSGTLKKGKVKRW